MFTYAEKPSSLALYISPSNPFNFGEHRQYHNHPSRTRPHYPILSPSITGVVSSSMSEARKELSYVPPMGGLEPLGFLFVVFPPVNIEVEHKVEECAVQRASSER